jgi:hypothetical protein
MKRTMTIALKKQGAILSSADLSRPISENQSLNESWKRTLQDGNISLQNRLQ